MAARITPGFRDSFRQRRWHAFRTLSSSIASFFQLSGAIEANAGLAGSVSDAWCNACPFRSIIVAVCEAGARQTEIKSKGTRGYERRVDSSELVKARTVIDLGSHSAG